MLSINMRIRIFMLPVNMGARNHETTNNHETPSRGDNGSVKIEFVRLLQVQRDLYALPRGMERFREYIKTMTDAGTRDSALPLVAMNPVGKDHVPALIDEYLRLHADDAAERTVTSLANRYSDIDRSFKVALVVADDLKGGWTNL